MVQIKLNNAKALYLEGIRDGHYEKAVNTYTGDRYTQHSTGVKDGKEGFIEFFPSLLPVILIAIFKLFAVGKMASMYFCKPTRILERVLRNG